MTDDELTSEVRAELHASLDRALEDSDARGMEACEYLQRDRVNREERSGRDFLAGRPPEADSSRVNRARILGTDAIRVGP